MGQEFKHSLAVLFLGFCKAAKLWAGSELLSKARGPFPSSLLVGKTYFLEALELVVACLFKVSGGESLF